MTHTTHGTRIGHATYTPGTWAGGATRGIWSDPPEAIATPGAALAWAGTAVIGRAAPYSHFAGRARLQILLHGTALQLHFRDPAQLVALDRRGQHEFDGERPVEAAPQGGPVVAFNLIYRRGVRATAQVVTIDAEPLAWPPELTQHGAQRVVRLLYVVAGALSVLEPGRPPVMLGADDAFVLGPHAIADPSPVVSLAPAALAPAELVLAALVWEAAEPLS